MSPQELQELTNNKNIKRGGFKKIKDFKESCMDKEHNPPSHICLSPGVYEYECPSCGAKKIITIPQVMMTAADKFDDDSPDYIRQSIEEI